MLRNFWGKILGKEDVQKPVQSGWEFNYAMDFVRQTLQYEQSKQDQIIILEYMSRIIKEDLKSDLLTTILYNKENFDKNLLILDGMDFKKHSAVIADFSSSSKRPRRVKAN